MKYLETDRTPENLGCESFWCWKKEKWLTCNKSGRIVSIDYETKKVEETGECDGVIEIVSEKPRYTTQKVCVACSGVSLRELRFLQAQKNRFDNEEEERMRKSYYDGCLCADLFKDR